MVSVQCFVLFFKGDMGQKHGIPLYTISLYRRVCFDTMYIYYNGFPRTAFVFLDISTFLSFIVPHMSAGCRELD